MLLTFVPYSLLYFYFSHLIQFSTSIQLLGLFVQAVLRKLLSWALGCLAFGQLHIGNNNNNNNIENNNNNNF